MDNLGIKLNPLTKLRIYQECRKRIFAKMDNSSITPERGDEIMSFVSANVINVADPVYAKNFYEKVADIYPELEEMRSYFERIENEKIDKVLGLLVEGLLIKGEFDLAERIMTEIKEIENKEGKSIEDISKSLPEEFEKAMEQVKKESKED